jgi:hypothetical protein
MVRCKVCSIVEHKEKLLVLKFDALKKYNGRGMCKVPRHKVVGKCCISFESQHVWNENIYGITSQMTFGYKVRNTLRLKKEKNCVIYDYVSSFEIGETPR